MENYEITEGNTITTKQDRRGVSVTGLVLSKGPKNCSVKDSTGGIWTIPYHMITECSVTTQEITIPKAKKGQIIITTDGDKFKVDRVNTTRYTATRLRDNKAMYVNFHFVKEVLDLADSQRAWLLSKGMSEQDIAEFEKNFVH